MNRERIRAATAAAATAAGLLCECGEALEGGVCLPCARRAATARGLPLEAVIWSVRRTAGRGGNPGRQ